MEKKRTMSVSVPHDLWEEVAALADEMNTSRSAVVTLALRSLFRRREQERKERERRDQWAREMARQRRCPQPECGWYPDCDFLNPSISGAKCDVVGYDYPTE